MKSHALFAELETLLARLDVTLREERLGAAGPSVRGGLYRREGKWYCILDSKSPVSEKNEIVARGLAGMNLHGVYMKPAVREFINLFVEETQGAIKGDKDDEEGGAVGKHTDGRD